MYHFCRTFKRDKNSRLLVKTLKRKVLLFSYIFSIKKVNNIVDLFTLRGIDRSLLPSFFRATIDFRLAFRLEDFQSGKADFLSLIFLPLFASIASITLSLYIYRVKHIRVIRTKRTETTIYSLMSL